MFGGWRRLGWRECRRRWCQRRRLHRLVSGVGSATRVDVLVDQRERHAAIAEGTFREAGANGHGGTHGRSRCMRAFGRAGWLLCRWPLEESIHAESYTDVSSILVCGRLTFPPIPIPVHTVPTARENSEWMKEDPKSSWVPGAAPPPRGSGFHVKSCHQA